MAPRGETIYTNRVMGPGEGGELPGTIENARHAHEDRKEKKHQVGIGSAESSEKAKDGKEATYEPVDPKEAEKLVARIVGMVKGIDARQRARNLKELRKLMGVEKMKLSDEQLGQMAEGMLEHGAIPKDFFMAWQPAETAAEKTQPHERNDDRILAILKKPQAKVDEEDFKVLHNAKVDEDLFARNPDVWMKVISELRGRYHGKTDNRRKDVYRKLTSGVIGERFQSLLEKRRKNQPPPETAALPVESKPGYDKAAMLKRIGGGTLTMRELQQAFMDAREQRDTEVALAALDKAESIYAKDILTTTSQEARDKIAFKIREIHADRKAIQRAIKINEPVIQRTEIPVAQPIEPQETSIPAAAAAETAVTELSPENIQLRVKFDEYNEELKQVEENLKAAPKNGKLKKRQAELLALCAEIYNKLNPPKEKNKGQAKNNNVDTGKHRFGDHQLDDYEVVKIQDRIRHQRSQERVNAPDNRTPLSPEQEKELQLKKRAEQFIDKQLEIQMNSMGMNEVDKTAQRNTPFYKRERNKAVLQLLEKIKPKL